MPWPARNTLLPGCRTYSPDRRGQVRRRSALPRAAAPPGEERGWAAARTARPFPDLLLAGRVSGAEVRDRRGTADALDPDVLDPGDVGCNVVGGDDHLRGEGLV